MNSLNANDDIEDIDREGDGANQELDFVIYDNVIQEDEIKGEDIISAPISKFSHLSEIDEKEVNKWMSWISMETFKIGGEFCVGQEFSNKKGLTEAVTNYSIQRNQIFRVSASRPHTITYKCGRAQTACTWSLRGTRKTFAFDAFTIVSYKGSHATTCASEDLPVDHRNLASKFISFHIKNLVEADMTIKIRVIIEVIKLKFHYTISYKKAWLAKQKAIAEIFGDWEESYEALPLFMQAMKDANPGTIVHFANHKTTDPKLEIFQRVFWSFGPSIMGFQHCRPLITIDGTHLYGKYKGTLLIAMGIDANNQLFPLAFAVVEGENNSSWPWFMACVRRFVTQREKLCVISDRHLGIMKAMNEDNTDWREPHAYHRLCIRHLASNISTHFQKEIKNTFGWTATQHQNKKFNWGFDKIREMNVKACQYLGNIDASMWSLCHDGGFRYGLKTTNLAEVFNNVLKGACFLPITALVKMTFYRVNSYFVQRRECANKRFFEGHMYSDKIAENLEANKKKAAHHKVEMFHFEDGIFQVTTARGERESSKGSHTHTVNFKHKTCTCKKLQIYKIPCSHVLACCRAYNLSFSQFVDPFFSSGEYIGTYEAIFNPIPEK